VRVKWTYLLTDIFTDNSYDICDSRDVSGDDDDANGNSKC
jgi:hypothetical protein